MKRFKKLILIWVLMMANLTFGAKPSSGEVDCEKPVGDSAKRTCENCGYVYDGAGKIKTRPNLNDFDDKSKTSTATEK